MEDFTIKNRRNRTSLKNFEKDLLELGLLKLGRLHKSKLEDKDVYNFILNYLKIYNKEYSTYYVKTNKRQEIPNKRRSAGDIFRLCKYYFPDCTFIEVLKHLDGITNIPGICSSVCGTIWKRVFRSVHVYESPFGGFPTRGTVYSELMKDEFGRIPGDYLKL